MTTTPDQLMAFREKHDKRIAIPKKIREALARLADGEKWIYEGKLQGFAGVGSTDLSEMRDHFSDHIVSISENGKLRHIWCGTVEFAEELRKIPGVR